ncbi:MAG: peptidyl-prolyl cis-trans isomerase [Deltaproteobacteria bacterium]|nr:peptidyl-prolyl cis-trans isomerase [Deltaproteobacteria bacterium]
MENKIIFLILSLIILIALIPIPCFAGEPKADEKIKVNIKTSLGEIILTLNPQAAPKTVDNFIAYVKAGFYEGTVFHRVIKGFMIQGGGLNEKLKEKQGGFAPIQNEADNGLKNLRGSIAMARTNDPNSATAQFFINTVDNDFLNHQNKTMQGWGYCVFGAVEKGLDIVDKIEAVPTTVYGQHQDVPVAPIRIEKVSLVEE